MATKTAYNTRGSKALSTVVSFLAVGFVADAVINIAYLHRDGKFFWLTLFVYSLLVLVATGAVLRVTKVTEMRRQQRKVLKGIKVH